MKRILFCAQDPGGANAIAPLVHRVAQESLMPYNVFASKYAFQIFQNNGIKRIINCSQSSRKDLRRFYDKINPHVIFTGTSEGYCLEKEITRIASRRGAKTISIVDSWMNYAKRYSSAENPRDLLYMTETICVNDEFMKSECVKDGIPPENLKITGNPYLAESAKKINKRRAGKGNKSNLLFISQPLSHGDTNQYSLMKDLLNFPSIEQFKSITVRPHPKENESSKYPEIITRYKDISIKVDHTRDIYKLINKSDLIIGVNSIVLFECAVSGKVVISYQPHRELFEDDMLINNRIGLSYKAYSKNDFYGLLSRYMDGILKPLDCVAKYKKVFIKPKAAENIICLIKKVCETNCIEG